MVYLRHIKVLPGNGMTFEGTMTITTTAANGNRLYVRFYKWHTFHLYRSKSRAASRFINLDAVTRQNTFHMPPPYVYFMPFINYFVIIDATVNIMFSFSSDYFINLCAQYISVISIKTTSKPAVLLSSFQLM